MESDINSDPVNYGGRVTLVASGRGSCAPATECFFLRHGSPFPAREPEWPTVRFRAIGRENLDRGFHLHDVPGAMSDDQHPDERITKAVGKDRCAFGLV